MSDFINTTDQYGDENVLDKIASKTIVEFRDNIISVLKSSAFYQCEALETVVLPAVIKVNSSVFSTCSALKYADFSKLTDIGSSMFNKCTRLYILVLRNETLVTCGSTGAFSSTPFDSGNVGGTLLVPRDLLDNYKTATNWSSILSQNTENRFLPLEDYTVDGTITGDIDFDLFADDMAREFIRGTFYGEYVNDTIVNITRCAFYASYFKKIIVPNALTAGASAFYNNSIEYLDIRSMTTMSRDSIYSLNLRTVILPANPPDSSNGDIVFSNTTKACIFYVPTGSLALYQAHKNWSNTTKNYIFIEEDR